MLAVVFLMTLFVDYLVGVFLPKNPYLVFPPMTEVVYKTKEFEFTASINSLGFRDRSFTVRKNANYRIVAIGDSFTYGWGVTVENSWPKVLERNLRDNGWQVEIANLGKPSADPIDYAEIAERAIPLLKPDLVVVGILQGEDWRSSLSLPNRKLMATGGTTFGLLYLDQFDTFSPILLLLLSI